MSVPYLVREFRVWYFAGELKRNCISKPLEPNFPANIDVQTYNGQAICTMLIDKCISGN